MGEQDVTVKICLLFFKHINMKMTSTIYIIRARCAGALQGSASFRPSVRSSVCPSKISCSKHICSPLGRISNRERHCNCGPCEGPKCVEILTNEKRHLPRLHKMRKQLTENKNKKISLSTPPPPQFFKRKLFLIFSGKDFRKI